MSDLKWGILGCGVIANEMAQAFEKMGRKVSNNKWLHYLYLTVMNLKRVAAINNYSCTH